MIFFSIYHLFHLTKHNLNNIYFSPFIHCKDYYQYAQWKYKLEWHLYKIFENQTQHKTKQCSQSTSSKHKIEEKWSKLNCCLCHHFLFFISPSFSYVLHHNFSLCHHLFLFLFGVSFELILSPFLYGLISTLLEHIRFLRQLELFFCI